MNRLFLILAVFVFLVVSGCGLKTEPVPPQTVLPAPIQDLSYSLDEKGMTLIWSYPQHLENGSALDGVDDFEILRAVVPEADYCAGCPVAFEDGVAVSAEELAPNGRETMVRYNESILRPGDRYFFKVRSRKGFWGVSRDSNTVSFVWKIPARAPENLRLKVGDRALTLSWRSPATYLDGRQVDGSLVFQVYRSEDGRNFRKVDGLVPGNAFVDDTVENGKKYQYQVRAIRAYDKTRVAGVASKEVSGTPRDMTPPAPPRNLVAVETAMGIKLSWEVSGEKDLAGYRVYRRKRDDSSPSLLCPNLTGGNSFVDRKPPRNADEYYYSVTAFDQAEPPNESPRSKEAVAQAVKLSGF